MGDRRHDSVDRLSAGVENPETLWRDRQLERRRLGLTDFILGEVLQGVSNKRHFVQVQLRIAEVSNLPHWRKRIGDCRRAQLSGLARAWLHCRQDNRFPDCYFLFAR